MKVWLDGKLVNEKKAQTSVASHALHYGTSVFEGIRFYETDEGPAVFRLKEHLERLHRSARQIGITGKRLPSQKRFREAITETIRANKFTSGYIRPIIFYAEGGLGISTAPNTISSAVITLPWDDYLEKNGITVKTSFWRRISPLAFNPEVKIGGVYANSVTANREAREAGAAEALLYDQWGYVAEGPGENIFLVKNGRIRTPQRGSILPGITRDTVMQLATDRGYDVAEKRITEKELLSADEIFMVGTAAEVTPVTKIDTTKIGDGKQGPVSKELDDLYNDVVRGKAAKKYRRWLTFVE